MAPCFIKLGKDNIDRIFIAILIGPKEAAIYIVGQQLSVLINFAAIAFNKHISHIYFHYCLQKSMMKPKEFLTRGATYCFNYFCKLYLRYLCK